MCIYLINTAAIEDFPWPIEDLGLLSYQFYKYQSNSQTVPKNNVPTRINCFRSKMKWKE
jgi:hypothetical protein